MGLATRSETHFFEGEIMFFGLFAPGAYGTIVSSINGAFQLEAPVARIKTGHKGRIISNKRKRPGRYIPGGPNRNCGWNGISPKLKRKHAA